MYVIKKSRHACGRRDFSIMILKFNLKPDYVFSNRLELLSSSKMESTFDSCVHHYQNRELHFLN
jgi:hypothetical protein